MVVTPLKPEELNEAERRFYDYIVENEGIEYAKRFLTIFAERRAGMNYR